MNIKVFMFWSYVYELLKTWMFSNKKIHNVKVQKTKTYLFVIYNSDYIFL